MDAKMSAASEAWRGTYDSRELAKCLVSSHDAAADGPQRCAEDSVPFLLLVRSLQGLAARQVLPANRDGDRSGGSLRAMASKKESPGQQKTLRVAMTLFSAEHCSFVGRTWTSESCQWEDQTTSVQQNVAFHTSSQDTSLHVVMELVLDSREHSAVCIGWCLQPLAQLLSAAMQGDDSNPGSTSLRLKVYHGSPRCLLHMSAPFDDDRRLVSRIGTELICNLSIHSSLVEAMSFLTSNTFYSVNTLVPGLRPSSSSTSPLMRPRLVASHSVILNKLEVRPAVASLDELEQQIINRVLLVAVAKDMFSSTDAVSAVITERKLKVALHNGHAVVRDPQTVLLDIATNRQSVPPSRASSRASSTRNSVRQSVVRQSPNKGRLSRQPSVAPGSYLQLSGQLEVHDVIDLEQFALVFVLEYMVSLRTAIPPVQQQQQQQQPLASSLVQDKPYLRKSSRANSTVSSAKEVLSVPVAHAAWSFPTPTPVVPSTPVAALQRPRGHSVAVTGATQQATVCLISAGYSDATNQFTVNTGAADTGVKNVQSLVLDFQYQSPQRHSPASVSSTRSRRGPSQQSRQSSELDRTVTADEDQNWNPDDTGLLSNDIVAVGDSLAFDRDELLTSSHTHGSAGRSDVSPQNTLPADTQLGQSLVPMATDREPGVSKQPTDPLDETEEQVTMVQTYTTSSASAAAVHGNARRHGYSDGAAGVQSDFPGARKKEVPKPTPVIAGYPGSVSLPRALLSLLNSSIFPAIISSTSDRGVVEVAAECNTVASVYKEMNDTLQGNDIVLQILALSKLQFRSANVFFRFHFYSFPQTITERCECMSADSAGDVQLLRRVSDEDTQLYGVEARFSIDWSSKSSVQEYVHYFSNACLQIQMFDAKSVLLIGSAHLPLQHLLRQGRPAVQASHALDVVVMETSDDQPYLIGDWTRQGTSRPATQNISVMATLYVRTANIGSPADLDTAGESRNHVVVVGKTSDILAATLPAAPNLSQRRELVKAKPRRMIDAYPDLRTMLGTDSPGKQPVLAAGTSSNGQPADSASVEQGVQQDVQQQKQQLQVIQQYRSRTKRAVIDRHHLSGITTHYTLYADLGVSHLIEFQLYNPFNVSTPYKIVFDDPDLHVVTDSKEWKHLKEQYGLTSPVEENMFTSLGHLDKLPVATTNANTNGGAAAAGDTTTSTVTSSSSTSERVMLRARECLNIPLKYCWSNCSQVSSSDTHHSHSQQQSTPQQKTVKVMFVAETSRSPTAILYVRIAHQPSAVHHTMHLQHGEQSIMKRCVRLSPATHRHAEQALRVFCNAPGVVTQVISEESSVFQDVYLKVPCSSAPSTQTFIVLLYRDEFMSRPVERWLCHVQSVHRVDISGQMYQSASAAVVLRGSNVAHNVQCYISKPNLLEVWPSGSFTLAAQAITDVQVTMRPTRVCNTSATLNAIDVDAEHVIATWTVHCSCLPPTITKVTHIKIPSVGGKHCSKKIHFKNSYATRKSFCVATSRRDLLQFKQTQFEVEAGLSQGLSLNFVPRPKDSKSEILVFINLDDGGNEECLSINVTYV